MLRIMPRKRRAGFSFRNRFMFKNIAKERIKRLLSMAEEKAHTNPDLSREYVSIAVRIGTKCRVRIPQRWKWRICKGCNTMLWPGLNCTIRIRRKRQHHIVTRCLYCGRISRRVINRESEDVRAPILSIPK